MNKLTQEEFLLKAKAKHLDKYDYSLVEYNTGKHKIIIICPEHGVFEQNASKHLCGDGCSSCSGNKKLNTKEFILRANKIHEDRYDYSMVEYNGFENKVKIICKIHGVFEQTPNKHIGKTHRGCPKCNGGSRKTSQYFIEECNKVHNNKYDYSLVNYINSSTNVKIICNEHGVFEQRPAHHLNGSCCSKCNKSKGETFIKNYFINHNINFIQEKSFEKCKYLNVLPFDFYLPIYNCCIEFDGQQHYRPVEYFGGEKAFKLRQKRDKIKTEYCKNNDITLFRIKYNDNIENKLIEYGFGL